MTGNEQVYPVMEQSKSYPEVWYTDPGITIRQQFAAMAMQGILSSGLAEPHTQEHFNNIAEDAVRTADALINQLNKP